MTKFQMDEEIRAFVTAHRRLRDHDGEWGLKFTLDGKLVGDLAEVLAAQLFDLQLCKKRTKGVDGHAWDGRSVQVKCTGSSRKGPAFTPGEGKADHLIFLQLDFEKATGTVAYNGPEAPIRQLLPAGFAGTKRVSLTAVLAAGKRVAVGDQLPRVR